MVEASSTDEQQIEDVVATFFAAFDNRGGAKPAIRQLGQMFAPNAIITCLKPTGPDTWTVEAFIAPRAAMLSNGTLTEFHEWPTSGKTETLGPIASHTCSYRKAGLFKGAVYEGGGDQLFQLVKSDGQWKIIAVVWWDME